MSFSKTLTYNESKASFEQNIEPSTVSAEEVVKIIDTDVQIEVANVNSAGGPGGTVGHFFSNSTLLKQFC